MFHTRLAWDHRSPRGAPEVLSRKRDTTNCQIAQLSLSHQCFLTSCVIRRLKVLGWPNSLVGLSGPLYRKCEGSVKKTWGILFYSSLITVSARHLPHRLCPTEELSPTPLFSRVGFLGLIRKEERVLVLRLVTLKQWTSTRGVTSRPLPPLVKCFMLLCLPQRKTSTCVSRAYDKPEILELSSVDPRVLMEQTLSLHYVAEKPLSLRYTPLKRSFSNFNTTILRHMSNFYVG